MTQIAQQYRRETESLKRYYHGRDSPVLEYISVTERYISRLKERNLEELLDEIEYNELFQSVLCLIGKAYPPDQFLSIVRAGYVKSFSPEFMGYILAVKRQFTRSPLWEELCSLDYCYSCWQIKWLCKTHFRKDPLGYAIKNISLKMLWGFGN